MLKRKSTNAPWGIVNAVLGELQKTKCRALVNGKPCGLAVSVVDKELETGTEIYECPLGHRTYMPLEAGLTED